VNRTRGARPHTAFFAGNFCIDNQAAAKLGAPLLPEAVRRALSH